MPTNEKKLGYLFFLTSRAHHKSASRIFERIGLGRAQPPVLFVLGERDGATQSELADALEVSQPTITNLLRRIEAAGLVSRVPDSSDSRSTRVYLTETGKARLSEARELARELDEIAFSGFTPPEREMVTAYLERMHTNLTRASND